MEISIRITNLSQIRKAFAASPRIMSKNLIRAINRSILKIGRDATINAPVDTGRLRASMLGGNFKGGNYRYHYGTSLARTNKLSGSIGTDVQYAVFVHQGTRFMRARPFLKKAVDSNKGFVDNEFKVAVRDTLNEIARKAG